MVAGQASLPGQGTDILSNHGCISDHLHSLLFYVTTDYRKCIAILLCVEIVQLHFLLYGPAMLRLSEEEVGKFPSQSAPQPWVTCTVQTIFGDVHTAVKIVSVLQLLFRSWNADMLFVICETK